MPKLKISPIDNYIAQFPKEVQSKLKQIRKLITDLAPKAEETISYGIPTFKLNGNLVHFAAFKKHIGFFPAPSAIVKFKKELATYKTSKGSIHLDPTQPMPLELLKKIVKFRIKETK